MCDFYRIYDTNSTLIYNQEKIQDWSIIDNKDKFFMLYNELKPRIVVPWCKIYKSEILNGIVYPEGKVHEDAAVIPEILYKVNRIAIFNEKLFFYLKRKESITQKISEEGLWELQNLKDRNIFFQKKVNNTELLNENAIKICECTIRCYKNLTLLNLPNKDEMKNKFYNDYKYYYKNYIDLKKLNIKKRIQLYAFYRTHKIYNFIYVSLARIYRKINNG